ncbi:hypothetical protein DAKH74_039900, partial [Maudiozyma humilis]
MFMTQTMKILNSRANRRIIKLQDENQST